MVASWKDQLRPASYKGVSFFWTDANTTFDPLTVAHKYVYRRQGWTEETGLGPDEMELVGYVLGADYMDRRDRLVQAIKEGGAGTLVHPTLGEKTVVVTAARLAETTKDGGMARFTLTFKDQGENAFPADTSDTQSAVEAQAAAARAASQDEFNDTFETAGLDSVESDAAAAVRVVAALIGVALAGLRGWDQGAASSVDLLDGLVPATVAADLSTILGSLAAPDGDSLDYTDGAARLAALAQIAAINLGAGGIAQQDVNRAALTALIHQQAAIAAAQTAATMQFAARDDAVAARDQVAGLIDQARIEDDARGGLFQSLTDLRAAAVAHLSDLAGSLAQIRVVEMTATFPAALIAYRQLNDASRADDVVARNRSVVWNPLFIAAGTRLEVLDG